MKRFEVELYEDEHGSCPIASWLLHLDRTNNKESRLTIKKVYYQIERLEFEGLSLGEPIIKHFDQDIWELRPIPHRIFFAMMKANKIVLLHHYCKRSQKTPKQEIEKAKRELANWLTRGDNI